MDLDEVLGMCSKRDEERKKLAKLPVHDATKVKQNSVPRPAVSFEELMAKADENSQKATAKNVVVTTRRSTPSKLPKQLEIKAAKPRNTSKSVKKLNHKSSVVPDDSVIKLNQQKRDLRSIEQIQNELKKEKKISEKPTI